MVGNPGIVDDLLGMNRQGKPLLEGKQCGDGLRRLGSTEAISCVKKRLSVRG